MTTVLLRILIAKEAILTCLKLLINFHLQWKAGKPPTVFGHEYACCPVIENTLIGWGFEHSDLMNGVPDYSSSLEKLIFKWPSQPKPCYDSVIYLHERQYFPRTWNVTALLKAFETLTLDMMTVKLWEINRK